MLGRIEETERSQEESEESASWRRLGESTPIEDCDMCQRYARHGLFSVAVARALARRYCLASNCYHLARADRLLGELDGGTPGSLRDDLSCWTRKEFFKKALKPEMIQITIVNRTQGKSFVPALSQHVRRHLERVRKPVPLAPRPRKLRLSARIQ